MIIIILILSPLQVYSYFSLSIFFASLLMIAIQGYKKSKIHSKLLKELYPEKLKGVEPNSFTGRFKVWLYLDFWTIIWSGFFIYYTHIQPEKMNVKAKEYHFKLLRSNRLFGVYLLVYLMNMAFYWFVFPHHV